MLPGLAYFILVRSTYPDELRDGAVYFTCVIILPLMFAGVVVFACYPIFTHSAVISNFAVHVCKVVRKISRVFVITSIKY